MEYIMETKGLTKSFHDHRVVDNVDIHVKKGTIYGFVGPNGAGKSTILKMLLNLVKPDKGEIYIFGSQVAPKSYEILKNIGSLIENPYFYDKLTARENLELHCEYMGYHNKEQIANVLDMVNLKGIEGKAVKNFSLGMKQRLAIARAIVTRPQFLILDEPINALDPEGIKEMRELFLTLKNQWNMTILISSHILSEVELIADTIGVIREGRLLKEVPMSEIHRQQSEYIEMEVDDVKRAACILEEKLKLSKLQFMGDKIIRTYCLDKSGKEIAAALIEGGVGVESISKQVNSLEDYFFEITKEDGE